MNRSDVLHALWHGTLMAALFLGGLALLHQVYGWGEAVLALVFGTLGTCAELVRRHRARRRTTVPDSTP